eukprot:scpid105661/ scgid4372/ 
MGVPKRPERGGYRVQPGPTPPATAKDKKVAAGVNNQKERLFSRGKAMSGEPSQRGKNQLPTPPTKKGIKNIKIMTRACLVTAALYRVPSPSTERGEESSQRKTEEKAAPPEPATAPKSMYRAPISLWLVVDTQTQRKKSTQKAGSQGGITAAKVAVRAGKGTKRHSEQARKNMDLEQQAAKRWQRLQPSL